MQVFTLYSSVFLRLDETAAVFYNTRTFSFVSYKVNPIVQKVCIHLSEIDNLYSIPVDEENIHLCKQLCELEFGTIHHENEIVLSFPPSLVLKNDWEYIKSIQGQTKTPVLEYLTKITLFVGGIEGIDDHIFYQTEYPYPGDTIMDDYQLSLFLDRTSKLPEIQVQYVFPFIDEYPGITKILKKIRSAKNRFKIIVRDREYYGSPKAKDLLNSVVNNVLVINDARNLYYSDISDSVENRFLVFDESSESNADECVAALGLSRYSYVAVYNGANENYIKSTSFPSEEEILKGVYTRKHIFSHQVLNTFYFGHLYITPNGNVYSDLMGKTVGTILDSFHSLVVSELENNYSWRCTRHSISKCQQCRLLDLCPSISPLEKIMQIHCVLNK
jgi:pseudo-rSAM protein